MKREHPFGPFIADDLKQIRLNAKTEDGPHALTCYHAQQYVEKVLKDVIWQYTGVMESGHNMIGLMDILGGILEERGIMDTDDPDFVAMRRLCSKLGPYNKNTRYPPASPFDERITFDERTAREAVGMAEAIVAWLDTVELDDGTPYAESRSLRSRMRRRKVRAFARRGTPGRRASRQRSQRDGGPGAHVPEGEQVRYVPSDVLGAVPEADADPVRAGGYGEDVPRGTGGPAYGDVRPDYAKSAFDSHGL